MLKDIFLHCIDSLIFWHITPDLPCSDFWGKLLSPSTEVRGLTGAKERIAVRCVCVCFGDVFERAKCDAVIKALARR